MDWLLVLIMVTLIALCWGAGCGVWYGVPGYGRGLGGLLGVLGTILLIVLVIMFVGNPGQSVAPTSAPYRR